MASGKSNEDFRRRRLSLVDQPAYGVAKRRMLDFLYRKHAHTDS